MWGGIADDADSTGTTLPGGNSGGPIVSIPTQTGCPTVTATGQLCSTCPVPACLGLATVTQYPCKCPAAIPTVYLDFPCSDSCRGIGCSTSYDIVTASETCPTSSYPPTNPPTTTTYPTSTPTPTTYPPGEPPTYPPSSTPTYPPQSPPPGTGTPPTPTSRPPFVNAAPRMGPFALFRFW